MTIAAINDAPKVVCIVKDKMSGEIFYNGDSNFEANGWYSRLLKEGKNPVYEKTVSRVFENVYSAKSLSDPDSLTSMLAVVPERVRSVYISLFAQKNPDPGALALAVKFHPEFFHNPHKQVPQLTKHI